MKVRLAVYVDSFIGWTVAGREYFFIYMAGVRPWSALLVCLLPGCGEPGCLANLVARRC